MVTLNPAPETAFGVATGTDGTYTLWGVPIGTYDVSATKPGLEFSTVPYEVGLHSPEPVPARSF